MKPNNIFFYLIFLLLSYTGKYNKTYYFFLEILDLMLPQKDSITYTFTFSIVSPRIYVKLMCKLFTDDGCLISLLLSGHFKRIFWKCKYLSIYPHFSLSTIFLLIHNKGLHLFTSPCLHIQTHYSIEQQEPSHYLLFNSDLHQKLKRKKEMFCHRPNISLNLYLKLCCILQIATSNSSVRFRNL